MESIPPLIPGASFPSFPPGFAPVDVVPVAPASAPASLPPNCRDNPSPLLNGPMAVDPNLANHWAQVQAPPEQYTVTVAASCLPPVHPRHDEYNPSAPNLQSALFAAAPAYVSNILPTNLGVPPGAPISSAASSPRATLIGARGPVLPERTVPRGKDIRTLREYVRGHVAASAASNSNVSVGGPASISTAQKRVSDDVAASRGVFNNGQLGQRPKTFGEVVAERRAAGVPENEIRVPMDLYYYKEFGMTVDNWNKWELVDPEGDVLEFEIVAPNITIEELVNSALEDYGPPLPKRPCVVRLDDEEDEEEYDRALASVEMLARDDPLALV